MVHYIQSGTSILAWCIFTNHQLKPWYNRKGQTFVGMLIFFNPFFEECSWFKLKKELKKNIIPTNVWPFLFWHSPLIKYKPLNVKTMKEDFFYDISYLYSELLRNYFANRKQTNLKGTWLFLCLHSKSLDCPYLRNGFVCNMAYDSKYDA